MNLYTHPLQINISGTNSRNAKVFKERVEALNLTMPCPIEIPFFRSGELRDVSLRPQIRCPAQSLLDHLHRFESHRIEIDDPTKPHG